MVKTKLFTSLAKINKTTMSSLDLHENAAFRNTQTLICVLSIWFSKPTLKNLIWPGSLFKFFGFQDFPGVSRRETLSGALLIHGNLGRCGILIMEIA